MDLEPALHTFFEESDDLLREMEHVLLAAEHQRPDAEAFNALFRSIHTIKGSAGLFGMEQLVTFTHQVENILDQLRDGILPLDTHLIQLLLRCHDHIKAMLQALQTQNDPQPLDHPSLLQELHHYLQIATPSVSNANAPPEAKNNAWVLSLQFGPDVFRHGLDPASFIHYLKKVGRIEQIHTITANIPAGRAFNAETNYLRLEVLYHTHLTETELKDVFTFVQDNSEIFIWPLSRAPQHLSDTLASATQAEALAVEQTWQQWGIVTASTIPPAPTHNLVAPLPDRREAINETYRSYKLLDTKFIKVEANKLDQLINLVGELVIAGASANLIAQRSHQNPLLESTQMITHLIEQIRASALAMRMTPIGEIFSRFDRMIYDLFQSINKVVQLHITGADTELDKSMLEKLSDPLTHLVRNALDHGIESSTQRLAQGKTPEGHIRLNAYHESGSIVIEISDDGQGLNPERILAKAIEHGLTSSTDLPTQDIFKFIFEAGFSTATTVTNLSGRGVGLDVVRKNIEQLHGTIEIESLLGVGTTFRIRLPLTLSIIDGFLVEAGGATFVIPVEMVFECIALPATLTSQRLQNGLNVRNEWLPLLHLSHFLNLPSSNPLRQSVVVVCYGRRKAGLVVDMLLGETQTVIKPLGQIFHYLKAIGGATILGTGEVALILDIPALIQQATQIEQIQYAAPCKIGGANK